MYEDERIDVCVCVLYLCMWCVCVSFVCVCVWCLSACLGERKYVCVCVCIYRCVCERENVSCVSVCVLLHCVYRVLVCDCLCNVYVC